MAKFPDIDFIAPMLRRRLSSLSRIVLRLAYDCAYDAENVRIIFASRHGELARTTTMLENLANKEELSPTSFSMSVLNASTGLFSIFQKNNAPCTAISAGNASFGCGLVEACLQLAENPGQPTLFIYADELAPVVYKVEEPISHCFFAVGMLLDASATTRISCSSRISNSTPSKTLQAQAFIPALNRGEAAWHETGRTWVWKREA